MEKLIFVSQTEFVDTLGERALCKRVKDWHIFFVPVHREVTGYVLSDPSCSGQNFAKLDPEMMTLLLQSGMIADDVPASPTQSAHWVLGNYISLILGALLILFVALRRRRKPADVDIQVPGLKQTPMFNETLLTTMFHTAQLDGNISQNTLQALLRTYKHLTGKTVSPQMITAKYAQMTKSEDLLSIMAPFSRIERDTMMKGCIDVAVADGEVGTAENDFLQDLNNALRLDGTLFRSQVRAVLRPTEDARTLSAA